MANLEEILRKTIQQTQEAELERQKKEWEENQQRLISHIYKESRAYTNLIIVAGYAGYFSIWFTMKPSLSPIIDLVVALLLVISLASFVLFEIYKSFIFTVKLKDPTDYMKEAKTYQDFSKGIEEYTKEFNRLEMDQKPIWAVSFFTSVISGLAGVGILLFFLISELITKAKPFFETST